MSVQTLMDLLAQYPQDLEVVINTGDIYTKYLIDEIGIINDEMPDDKKEQYLEIYTYTPDTF